MSWRRKFLVGQKWNIPLFTSFQILCLAGIEKCNVYTIGLIYLRMALLLEDKDIIGINKYKEFFKKQIQKIKNNT